MLEYGWHMCTEPFKQVGGSGGHAGMLRTLAAATIFGLCMSSSAYAAGDAERGKMLYETRCSACHERSVHQSSARKAKSFEALRAQVLRWSAQAGGLWSADEIEDVTLYLNERYYHHPCPQTVCKADQASIAR
jgi:mono/diheme cytochrome c family protein